MAELNNWMCNVLSLYATYPADVKEIIDEFLTLDADNPVEPQNKIILEM
jgi:hypothetical protein